MESVVQLTAAVGSNRLYELDFLIPQFNNKFGIDTFVIILKSLFIYLILPVLLHHFTYASFLGDKSWVFLIRIYSEYNPMKSLNPSDAKNQT